MNNETNPQPQADRTFTQDEVNKIVSDRLNEDRQKREQPKPDPIAEREAELAKREFALEARYMLKDKGHNERLLEVLNAPDKESLEKCLAVIDEIYGDPGAKPIIITKPVNTTGSISVGTDRIRAAMGLPNR